MAELPLIRIDICWNLSEEYLSKCDSKGSKEALNNIQLAKTNAVLTSDLFHNLCKLQDRWKKLIEYSNKREVRSCMQEIVKSR